MRYERIWGIWVLTSEIMRLGDFCTFVAGSSFPDRYQGKSTGDYPFIKVSDMKLEMNQYRILVANNWIDQNEADELRARPIPAGSIVFAKIGAGLFNNRMRLTTMPTLMDNNMMAAIPKKGVSSDVLYSIMNTLDMQTWAIGAALPYIRGTDLEKIKLKHISFDNLSRTSEIESKINLMKDEVSQNSQTLSKIASVLFRSWFLDFDPVKAKSEGKLPNGMDDETAALFPDSFENSENGELPKGWTWGTLLDISKIWTGGTPKTSESSYWGGDIPWVSGADLSSNDLFAFDSARKITSLGVEKSSTKVLPVGTVMITARGTVGATKITAVPMAMSQTSFGFKAKKGISDALVYQASQETIRQLRSFAYGAVFDTFTQSTIDITKIAIAPLEILQAFGKIVDPLFETMKNSAKEIIELSSTRDALLPRLMSGELKVN